MNFVSDSQTMNLFKVNQKVLKNIQAFTTILF